MKITVEALTKALGNDGLDGGILIHSDLSPLGGEGAPVKPAVYAGGLYQKDKRWTTGPDGERHVVDAVVIDNEPAEANRMEAALLRRLAQLGLPSFQLDLSVVGELPPHVSSTLSSLEFPHRHADAYLRDAELEDGTAFTKSAIGTAVYGASASKPQALLEWFPASLIFGFWQSHLGKKAPQTKFARAFECSIVGLGPASVETRRLGLKGDPLNLSISEGISIDDDGLIEWELSGSDKVGKKSKDSLAEIGHGQVPVSANEAALGSISFESIEQLATLSFPRLRTISTGDDQQDAAARALLAALAIVAHRCAFAGGFTLRSGCDLRATRSTWKWVGESADHELEVPTVNEAIELFQASVAAAEAAGLPVGTRWASAPMRLVPKANLHKVLVQSFGLDS
jgi:CRISPR-associated protein Csb1